MPCDLGAVGVESGQNHAVGVQVGNMIEIQHEVGRGIKGDFPAAEQRNPLPFADLQGGGMRLVGVGGLGLKADQPHEAGIRRAMAFAREGQRALQFHQHALHRLEPAGVFQDLEKPAGDSHRADGVRAGRTQADAKEVERRNQEADSRAAKRKGTTNSPEKRFCSVD